MKNRFGMLISAILCSVLVFAGCDMLEQQHKEPLPKTGVYDIDKDALPYTQKEIFEQLFDINNKIDIDIDISDEELQKIQKDYEKYSSMGSKSPIYRKAALDITITTEDNSYTYHIDEVGIRMKGNTSRTDFYNAAEGQYNLIHFKVDFQETFDNEEYYSDAKDWSADEIGLEERKDRTFATLEKLDLRWNKNDDSTYIREYYAYEMYRDNGVLAPHTNLATMKVADVHQGVFTIYEPVDKVFIEKYVAKEDQGGDLYKCGWAGGGAIFRATNTIGIEDLDKGQFYHFDLKTNKKTSTHEQMKNLLDTLNKSNVTKEDIEGVVDMDQFLKYEAVSYFVGNPDDLRNDYNNCYVYFLKSSGKAIIIPYDLDRSFGVTKDWNPTGDGMTGVNPFSQNAEGAGERQPNPLYIHTVNRGGYYVNAFADVLNEVAQSKWLTMEQFESIYAIAQNNYWAAAAPGKNFDNASWHSFEFDLEKSDGLNSSFANASFKDYLDAKMEAFEKYVTNVDKYVVDSVQKKYYIKGDFTDWKFDEAYEMTYDPETKTHWIMLTLDSRYAFKINDGTDTDSSEWYGYNEVMSYPEDAYMDSDKHDNIMITPGTYKVIFDPENLTIRFE